MSRNIISYNLVPDLLVKYYFMIKKNNIFIVNISIKILVKYKKNFKFD